jgi:hypothetical protein
MKLNRRNAIAVGASALVVVGGYEAFRLLRPHYPPTPYDDLLDRLSDRDAARQLGAAFLRTHPDFTPGAAARVLRRKVGTRDLSATVEDEAAHGELTEAGRWIIPQTLAGLCALAART